MTPEMIQALSAIATITVGCAVLSPILCWILPPRSSAH